MLGERQCEHHICTLPSAVVACHVQQRGQLIQNETAHVLPFTDARPKVPLTLESSSYSGMGTPSPVAPPAASTKPPSGSRAAGVAASAAARAPWATSRRAKVRYPVCPRVSGAGRGSACRGATAGSASPARAPAPSWAARTSDAGDPGRAGAATSWCLLHHLAAVGASVVNTLRKHILRVRSGFNYAHASATLA